MKFLRHAAHGLTQAKSLMHGAYHTTRKILQNVMFRRVLAAAQPALQDLRIQEQTNSLAMRAVGAYDKAKQWWRAMTDTHNWQLQQEIALLINATREGVR
jgi:hypothetical protein